MSQLLPRSYALKQCFTSAEQGTAYCTPHTILPIIMGPHRIIAISVFLRRNTISGATRQTLRNRCPPVHPNRVKEGRRTRVPGDAYRTAVVARRIERSPQITHDRTSRRMDQTGKKEDRIRGGENGAGHARRDGKWE
jgi:hypothetical protein